MSDDKDGKKEEQYKVFVGGLSYKLDDIGLREAFERFGPDEAQVILDKETGRSRAFGFVIFKDKTAMEDAIREMHESELDGRKISCRRAVPQSDVKPGTPAFALNGGGYGGRRDSGRRYDSRDSRGGYGGDRYGGGGGGYERGYDRGYGGGYGGGYGADPRYASYERGYGGGYERDPYPRDPYAREPSRDAYAYSGSYAHEPAYDRSYGYDARSAYPPAEYSRGSAYDDRGAGPDRSRYGSAPRAAAPYDRPTDGRRSDPPRPR